MQRKAASASTTDSNSDSGQELFTFPGGNTCPHEGGFLPITFGANYSSDTQLHNSHYSNNIMAPTVVNLHLK